MRKVVSFFCLVVFNTFGMDGSFFKHDNGWVYTGNEIKRLVDVLGRVKESVKYSTTRTEWECAFRDVFESEYSDPKEAENRATYFAWMQACIKRTTDISEGIDREVGWIEKVRNEGKGIFINHRPSHWCALNFLWNWNKEEHQKCEIDGKKENRTWEVDKWNPKK